MGWWEDTFKSTLENAAMPLYNTYGARSAEQYAKSNKTLDKLSDYWEKQTGDYRSRVEGASQELAGLASQENQLKGQVELMPQGVAKDYWQMMRPTVYAGKVGSLLADQGTKARDNLGQLAEFGANQAATYAGGQTALLNPIFGAIGTGMKNEQDASAAKWNILGQGLGIAAGVDWGKIFKMGAGAGAGAAAATNAVGPVGQALPSWLPATTITTPAPAAAAAAGAGAAGTGGVSGAASGLAALGLIGTVAIPAGVGLAAVYGMSKFIEWATGGNRAKNITKAYNNGAIHAGDPIGGEWKNAYWIPLSPERQKQTGTPLGIGTAQLYYNATGKWPTGYQG